MKHNFKTIIVDVLTIVLACFMVVFSQMRFAEQEIELPPLNLSESPTDLRNHGETSMSKPVVSIKSEGTKTAYYLNDQAVEKDVLFQRLKQQGAKGVVLRGDADTAFSWGELAHLNAQLYDSGIREIIYRLKEEKER